MLGVGKAPVRNSICGKIKWVRLKECHPDKFDDAKALKKDVLEHGSPLTCSSGESQVELEQPERVAQIVADYEKEAQRALCAVIPINPHCPARSRPEDMDDAYGVDESDGSCIVCHKKWAVSYPASLIACLTASPNCLAF